MSVQRIARFILGSVFLLVASSAMAQSSLSGAIAGVVRDTSGAVLPGVTVEAASPALIEKVRTAVTDDRGQYRVVDLRPGTYSVSFMLTGFSTLKREGIELATGVTIPANAEMKVGSLEETVTVTGASPVVDVQNVRTQNVISRAVLDSIPTSKTLDGYATLTLGATVGVSGQNVGGARGEFFSTISIHGTRGGEFQQNWDGFSIHLMQGGAGAARNYLLNQSTVQEIALQTGGMSAETQGSGVQLNAVPKDGGNTLKISLSTNGSGPGLQSRNLTDALRARGVAEAVSIKKLYDFGIGVGGPIRKDKIWFYAGNRFWGAQEYVPGNYWSKTQGTYIGRSDSGVSAYTPDLSRRAFINKPNKDISGRMTWQVTQKNKINYSHSQQGNCHCFWEVDNNRAPEASPDLHYYPSWLGQVTWSYPATNRLLLEGGVARPYTHIQAVRGPDSKKTDIAITELTTGYIYNSFALGLTNSATAWAVLDGKTKGDWERQWYQRFAVSYITGSHAFKTGFTAQEGILNFDLEINGAVSYNFASGLPSSIVQWTSPLSTEMRLRRNLALFAQDQWTIKRLTLNLGVRFDSINSYNPAQTAPGGRFYPRTTFAEVKNVPSWTDFNPRLGAAYDLFGNGRTAVKAYLGRYSAPHTIQLAVPTNPANALAQSASRNWNDNFYGAGDPRSGNFVPDCDLRSIVDNGECGILSNSNFGLTVPVTRLSPDLLTGRNKRPYNWQGSVSFQHELRPGFGLNVGYFRTAFGNFTYTDNLNLTPGSFSPYSVTAPSDSRLPGGGGQVIAGLYDINPSAVGPTSNLVTLAKLNGFKQSEIFNGADFGFNARFGRGGLLQGGVSVGRTVTDNCFAVDSPQLKQAGSPYCRVGLPWWAGATQIKFSGVYPLPGSFQTSATFQNLPGLAVLANLSYANAQVVSTLGRNLGSCGVAAVCNGRVTVPLIAPNTVFADKINQVDWRISRIFKIGRARLEGMFDVYNMFNQSDVLQENTTFGPTWRKPLRLLSARLFKVGAQFDF